MKFIELVRTINNEKAAIKFFQDHGIIPKNKLCTKRHNMSIRVSSKNTRWVCKKRQCRSEVGVRQGTWLQGSMLPLQKIIFIIYAWANDFATARFCEEELEIASEAQANYKNYMREVCANSILKNEKTIGGPGLNVEIDESCFSKRKYNVGRVLPQQWVFGGICRETKECFLYAVPDRTRETLFEVINARIEKGK